MKGAIMRKPNNLVCSLGLLMIATLSTFASAADCVPGTMANYRNLGAGGCTVEDKVFRKFFYESTVSVNGVVLTDPVTMRPLLLPPAANIQVAPIKALNPPPFSFNPGLEFSSNFWTVGPNETLTATIDYIVQVPVGNPLIKDASLTLRGNAVNGGSIRNVETVFSTLLTPNHIFLTAACDGTQALPCVAPGDPNLPQPMLFKEVQFNRTVDLVEVHNVFTLSCGANPKCSATVSGMENRFSEVVPIPEPDAWAMMLAGLTALGIAQRWGARSAARSMPPGQASESL